MLFHYKPIPHRLKIAQEFIEYIFYDVWCKANQDGITYGIHLYEKNEDLHKIIDDIWKKDLAGKLKSNGSAYFFYNGINEIFNEFTKLSDDEIEYYKSCFKANNLIEESCCGDPSVIPVTYDSIKRHGNNLVEKIEAFFKSLYSSGFFELKIVKLVIGSNLSDYYKAFVRENDECICPFCGLMPLDGEYDPSRDAFDHFLPKSKYPFNAINLKNLAPSCDKCNSKNKGEKDPLIDANGIRRKAFYPFSTSNPDTKIRIRINKKVWDSLKPEDLSIEIDSTNFQQETDTWKELFKIEERYAAKCCSKHGGSNWFNRVFSEHQNYNLSQHEMLDAELNIATNSPWVDAGFLKIAFLEGCKHAGLFRYAQSD